MCTYGEVKTEHIPEQSHIISKRVVHGIAPQRVVRLIVHCSMKGLLVRSTACLQASISRELYRLIEVHECIEGVVSPAMDAQFFFQPAPVVVGTVMVDNYIVLKYILSETVRGYDKH